MVHSVTVRCPGSVAAKQAGVCADMLCLVLSKHGDVDYGQTLVSSLQRTMIQKSCDFVQMETPPLVIAAASVLKDLCYKNREELQAGFITAGWDKKTGPQVYVVALGGMLINQPVTIAGSGSTYIYGYIDAKYKPNMTKEECIQFATNGTVFHHLHLQLQLTELQCDSDTSLSLSPFYRCPAKK
uniref:proteasome endopeptidase complex n=1 Tax=Amphilophus citrinellus TaxID=61819 RepID=A0A3Q0QXU5_AMPCI